MANALLGIGGNVGDVRTTLREACLLIEERCGKIVRQSSLYRSEPWGYAEQPWFHNAIVEISTDLSPLKLLHALQTIELELGRVRKENRYGERTIDIDILFYDAICMSDEGLVVPHPRLHERLFVLKPLNEIRPDIIHPLLNQTVREMLNSCPDKLRVELASPSELLA